MVKRATKADVKRALDRSEEFHGFIPRRVKAVEWNYPRSVVHLGHCAQVDYITDKYDKIVRQYFHEFSGRCDLFAADRPMRSGDEMLIIVGEFKITREGIVG